MLVIDNTSRGIGKGGTRMQPTVGVEEIARLARLRSVTPHRAARAPAQERVRAAMRLRGRSPVP